MHKIFFSLFILSTIFFNSCSEEIFNVPPQERYIYYPVSELDGVSPNETGLFFTTTVDSIIIKVQEGSIIYTSGIASNGNLLYNRKISSDSNSLNIGNNEPGYVSNIQIPQQTIPEREYWFIDNPKATHSYNNKYSAYFLFNKLKSVNEYGILNLVIFDHIESKSILHPLTQFIESISPSVKFNAAVPWGDYMFMNIQGTTILFALKVFKYENGIESSIKYVVVEYEYNSDVFKLRSPLVDEPFELVGYISGTENLIARFGNEVRMITRMNEFNQTYFKVENLSNPNQFAIGSDNAVGWTDNGIGLFDANFGTLKKDIIFYNEIDPDGLLIHELNKRLSISPDGDYIIFALPHKDNPKIYSLFIIDSDGKNFRKIIDSPMGIPVISNEFDIKEE